MNTVLYFYHITYLGGVFKVRYKELSPIYGCVELASSISQSPVDKH